MKYSVDRIEGSMVILQNIEDGSKRQVLIENFNDSIKENDIVIYNNGEYLVNKEETKNRYNSLKERLERLRKENR